MRISDWSSDVCSSDLLREKMVLTTKGGIILGVPYDSSAAYLTSAIDISLQRLRTDHVELWQIHRPDRSEEHTSELQSLMRISYAVFCLKKKKTVTTPTQSTCNTTQKI